MNTASHTSAIADAQNLSVESGETVRLDSQRYASAHKRVYPNSIDEVRAVIGLSDAATRALKVHKCCDTTSIPTKLASPDDLDSSDKVVSRRAKEVAIQAANHYVSSASPDAVAQWKPLINRFLEIGKISIGYCMLRDIEIADRGTLVVPASTRVLFANNIKIHGTGRILCEGDVTINCTTLQGIRPVWAASVAANSRIAQVT